ncbi:MAG TPA: hypothetical protein VK745_07750 [Polyangiaceae bacterium]|jgi:hypothetical protein|nr:hypothetical protein [Polyangiaceae bacterium]
MASAKRDIRHIIDSFSEDLIEIAKDVVQQHVERAVSEWQAKNSKLLLRKSAEDEKALRNQRALERIERVAARRRDREEKKATERALRLEQRVVEGKKPRARRGSLSEAAAKKAATPPPLFVHKRRRDGEIEQLKRNDDAEPTLNGAAQPAAEAAL